jgi:hypothetical protein
VEASKYGGGGREVVKGIVNDVEEGDRWVLGLAFVR